MAETKIGIQFVLIVLIVMAAVYYGFTQEPISINDGRPADSQAYFTMAEQVAAGDPISTLRPFAYRIALPFLVGTIFPHDIAFGFRFLNLFFATATVIVFFLFLRSCRLGATTAVLLVSCFVVAFQSPFRFAHFIPAYTDPPALFFIVLLLWLGRVISRLDLRSTLMVMAVSVGGVLFREISLCGLLVFVFAQCFRLRRGPPFLLVRSWRAVGLCALPLCASCACLALIHVLVDGTGGYGYLSHMRGVVSTLAEQPDIFLLAWLTSFGAIPFILFFAGRLSLDVLKQNQDVAVFLGGCALLGLFAGFHTDRIVFWSFPAVLLLFGVLLEKHPLRSAPVWHRLAFYIPLFAVQTLAWRVWLPIPDDPRGEVFNPGEPPMLLFSALGDTTVGHIYASTLPAASRLALLGQFVAAAAYFGLILHLAAKRQSRSAST
ncbi:MAG: hypothetical protein OXC17_02735 [Aestuariivita sp.]|nr:hypothetical protein [Aestuariivita sp.]